jgi:hypothetical protein
VGRPLLRGRPLLSGRPLRWGRPVPQGRPLRGKTLPGGRSLPLGRPSSREDRFAREDRSSGEALSSGGTPLPLGRLSDTCLRSTPLWGISLLWGKTPFSREHPSRSGKTLSLGSTRPAGGDPLRGTPLRWERPPSSGEDHSSGEDPSSGEGPSWGTLLVGNTPWGNLSFGDPLG